MHFVREIRLRRVKCLRAWVDLFHFTFVGTPNISQWPQVIISHPKDISLYLF